MKNNYLILMGYSENAHLHTYVYLETFAVKLFKKLLIPVFGFGLSDHARMR
ncbi:hypothetical protein MOMOMM108M1_09205 [Morganella morganii]